MENFNLLLPSLYAFPTFVTIVWNIMGPYNGRGVSGLLTSSLIIWPLMSDLPSIITTSTTISVEHELLQNISLMFLFFSPIYNERLCRQFCIAQDVNFIYPYYAINGNFIGIKHISCTEHQNFCWNYCNTTS